jgi:hypothetical protein
LKRIKISNLSKNLPKARKLSLISRAQLVLFKTRMMSSKRLINILKCNLMPFGQALQNLQTHPKLPKPPLVMVVKNAIMLIVMLFMLKASNKILSKLL